MSDNVSHNNMSHDNVAHNKSGVSHDNVSGEQVEDLRKKLARVEGVVQDLESCLKSAKSSQASAEDLAER